MLFCRLEFCQIFFKKARDRQPNNQYPSQLYDVRRVSSPFLSCTMGAGTQGHREELSEVTDEPTEKMLLLLELPWWLDFTTRQSLCPYVLLLMQSVPTAEHCSPLSTHCPPPRPQSTGLRWGCCLPKPHALSTRPDSIYHVYFEVLKKHMSLIPLTIPRGRQRMERRKEGEEQAPSSFRRALAVPVPGRGPWR